MKVDTYINKNVGTWCKNDAQTTHRPYVWFVVHICLQDANVCINAVLHYSEDYSMYQIVYTMYVYIVRRAVLKILRSYFLLFKGSVIL